jgi:hypothetical protein
LNQSEAKNHQNTEDTTELLHLLVKMGHFERYLYAFVRRNIVLKMHAFVFDLGIDFTFTCLLCVRH